MGISQARSLSSATRGIGEKRGAGYFLFQNFGSRLRVCSASIPLPVLFPFCSHTTS